MKKNMLLAILILCSLFLVVGCQKKEENNNSQNTNNNSSSNETKKSGVIVREDVKKAIKDETGVTLKTIAVEFVGNTLNFQVVAQNENGEDKELDCSKFYLKTQGGDKLKVNGTKKTVKANSSYNQFAFTVNDEGKTKEGYLVYAYFDNISMGPVEVSSMK